MMWILFLGTLIVSALAAARVQANYARFSRVAAGSGLSGAAAAMEILGAAGIHDVEVTAG